MGSLFSGPKISNPGLNKSLNNLSSGATTKSLKPIDISAGGLSGKYNNGRLSVTASGVRRGLVNSLSSTSLGQADLIAGLRGQIAPGMSGLRTARLREVENARQASISNLRDNLARRRVLGSSFGEDAATRAELEFAQQADKVAAESFLQELDLTNQLIGQEFDLRRESFSTKLNELNLQADFATNLSAQATQTLTASAQLQSQLAMTEAQWRSNIGIAQGELDGKAQEGVGAFIGQVGGRCWPRR